MRAPQGWSLLVSRLMSRALLTAIALCLLEGCVSVWPGRPADALASSDAAATHTLVERFDSLRLASRIPGLAVVVLRDTTVILACGLGLADVERRIPVTPETPFNIASVTKPISAVVALRLVQDGVLDLDRPMRSYRRFDEFCADVRREGGIFFSDYECESTRLTLRHLLSMTANGEPGTRFWYNPPSFSWASRPMAEVVARPFSSLVDSLVFRPAGMRQSARIHRKLPLRANLAARLALPYNVDAAGQAVRSDPPPSQGDGAAGGVIATAMDLARFDVALASGRLLSPAVRAHLWRPTTTPDGRLRPYGLGWFLGEYEGRRLAWHTGVWEGRYSALYLKTMDGASNSGNLTLILLANSDGLRWNGRLDQATIERSPFAKAFLELFPITRAAIR